VLPPRSSAGLPALLLASISAGALLGWWWPAAGRSLQPVGAVYLDLVFTAVVPLVFFTVASSVAGAAGTGRLSRVARATAAVFVGSSAVAAGAALLAWGAWCPGLGAGLDLPGDPAAAEVPALAEAIRSSIAVSDFAGLLSRRNVLPLAIAAVAVGVATGNVGERAAPFARWLDAGAAVMLRIAHGLSWLAPVGLFAWFATTAATAGEHLAAAYAEVLGAYLLLAGVWYVVAFSATAALAGGPAAARRMWPALLRPTLTAAGTCSSLATLPENLAAARRAGVPAEVGDLVLPVGAALHKDGSVIAAALKIGFLHAAYGRPLDGPSAALAVAVAVACGVVVGGVPTGGMVAEALILSAFGFPPEALPAIAVIGVLVDPAATVLNAVGDVPAALLIGRLAGSPPRTAPDPEAAGP
jgi:Na+/H+-dicarboxylate symporter